MICPLKFNSVTLNARTQEQLDDDCQCEEDECAWWDKTKRQCCFRTLAQEVQRLNNSVKVKK